MDEVVCRANLAFYTQSVIDGVDGMQCIHLDIESDLRTYLETYPSYPYICKFILSPSGSNVSIELDTLAWSYEGIIRLPRVEEIFEEDFYYPIHPGETPFWNPGVFLGETEDCSSFCITPVFIFPFKYNQLDHELFSLNKCVFRINIDHISDFTVESRYIDDLEELCFNYSAIEEMIDVVDSGLGDYLVIYSYDNSGKPQAPPPNLTDYKDALMPLMDYREMQGYNIRWAYISPGYTSSEVQNVIDYYMQIFDITNIILLGEYTRVPMNMFTYSGFGIISDTKYIEDYGRFGPRIGRFPGSPAEIETTVSKILEYEEYFSPDSRRPQRLFCNNMLFLAHEEHGFAACFETIMNYDPWYTIDLEYITYFREYGPISGSDIENTINSGVGIVSYRGHGAVTGYCWDVPSFWHTSDMMDLENDYYPVVFNITCNTGDHPSPSDQASGWLHSPNGGASGVLAATGVTWNPPNSLFLIRIFFNMFRDLFPQTSPLVADEVYEQLFEIRSVNPTWASMVNFYRYTWLGDPGQRLWTEESVQSRYHATNSIDSDVALSTNRNILESIESVVIGPNPSNSSVSIVVSANESSPIDISVYDIAGRKIDTIHNGEVSEGNNSFTWDNESFAQGLYMIRLTDNTGASEVERVMIIR